jgi:hypothetical protein
MSADQTTHDDTAIMQQLHTNPPAATEELPYRVELRLMSDPSSVERVLARALTAQLAQAIFRAALTEHPGRRIALCKGEDVISDATG